MTKKEIVSLVPGISFFKLQDALKNPKRDLNRDAPIYSLRIDGLTLQIDLDWDYAIVLTYRDLNNKRHLLYYKTYYDANDLIFFQEFVDDICMKWY